MKYIIIIVAAFECFFIPGPSFGEIRNGYDIQLESASSSLIQLQKMACDSPEKYSLETVKKCLEEKQSLVDELVSYHKKTQDVIDLIRSIDPVLYHKLNTISDRMGKETHIHIKIVANVRLGFKAATNLEQSKKNPHIYKSEFGEGTVSVWIKDINLHKNLWALVHEFGHIRYVVPQLAEYAPFYKKHYQESNYVGIPGHHVNDPSLLYVYKTLREFKKSWKEFKKLDSKDEPILNNVVADL
tara:strand:- start:141278 stop:142003 length:726 start_codon:yes stop_codon:yes gene_type:complete